MATFYRSRSAEHHPATSVAFDDDEVPREVLLADFTRRQFLTGARLLLQHGEIRPDGSCASCWETAPCPTAQQGARQALTYAKEVLGIDLGDDIEHVETDSVTPDTSREPTAVHPFVSAPESVVT